MKKILLLSLILLTLLSLCFLSSCDGEEVKKEVLNIYNWGEYISDGSEGSLDVNRAFEEYYFKTYGIEMTVNYTTYASNEDLYAKLKSGAAGYDVIIPSDYMIERMIEEGRREDGTIDPDKCMLEKLDFSNIPNYQYIADYCKGLSYDPNEEYSVAYTYGMVGIIYNTKMVDEADIGSWDLLWNEKYAGQILQFNNSRDAFGTAMYSLGIDVNTRDMNEWKAALELLKKQKSVVQSYVMDEIYNKMEKGEAAIAPYYAGDYLSMAVNNPDLAFYYPQNDAGETVTNIFVDAMCIPKGCGNKVAAERYINFMLSEEVAVANAEYIYYASPNSLVFENQGYQDDLGEDMEMLYPDIDFATVYGEYAYENLDRDTLQAVNDLWEELKIDSSTLGGGIYIACGILLALLIAWAIFAYVRKLRRRRYYW